MVFLPSLWKHLLFSFCCCCCWVDWFVCFVSLCYKVLKRGGRGEKMSSLMATMLQWFLHFTIVLTVALRSLFICFYCCNSMLFYFCSSSCYCCCVCCCKGHWFWLFSCFKICFFDCYLIPLPFVELLVVHFYLYCSSSS